MKYKINFINNSYKRFYKEHKKELLEAFERCMENGDLILREDVSKFENKLAEYTNTKYGVGVNSGTDALFLSIKALGIGGNWDKVMEERIPEEDFEGDEVITVAHTFIASIQAIVHNGAKPILIDVGKNELIDVTQIEDAITDRTKAILPVHFHGKVCDMDTIMSIAKKYNLYVIEDAAQALGSSYKGKPAGSFGDTGCFSFNTPKLMGAWGDGGGIVTNNKELVDKLYLLRNHWNMAQTSVRIADFPTPKVVQWAWKSRLDNIQAALLNVKFKYYPSMLKRRREIADMYTKGLKELPLKTPQYEDGDVIQEYILRIGNNNERIRFKEHMDEKGVELLIRDTIPYNKVKNLRLDNFSLPVTESISNDAVRLPAYPELTNEEINYTIKSIKEFYD